MEVLLKSKISIHLTISTMTSFYYVVLNNGYKTCLVLCEISTVILLILKDVLILAR